MIVVDASALIEMLLPTAAVETVPARFFDSGDLLAVPHLIDVEAAWILRRYARAGEIDGRHARPLIGNTLFLEYKDVLSRDEFATSPISRKGRTALLDAVLGVCQWIDISCLRRPNLRDESDNHLVESAVAGNAAWIVTGNERDVAAGELIFDGFRVVGPAVWLK